MGNLYVDTSKLSESGQDIIKLTSELNEEINALFNRISNISNTLEWVGTSAQDFIRRSNIEKAQYVNLKNTLYKYGKTLLNAASELETSAKNLR